MNKKELREEAKRLAAIEAAKKEEAETAKPEAASEEAINGYADVMLEALAQEGKALEEAAKATDAAMLTAWQVIRNTFRVVYERHTVKDAALLLERFKARATLQGDAKAKGRAANYASTLSKVLKLAEKGTAIPPRLWDQSRNEWNAKEGENADLFASVKTNRGRKATAEEKPEEVTGKANETGTIGQVVAAVTEDKALAELMKAVAPLRGDFRKEFMRGALELAQAIAKRQELATGTGGHGR